MRPNPAQEARAALANEALLRADAAAAEEIEDRRAALQVRRAPHRRRHAIPSGSCSRHR
jgi:hypothetical protein